MVGVDQKTVMCKALQSPVLDEPSRPKNFSVTYPLKVSTVSDVEQLTKSSSGMPEEQVTKILSRVLEAPKQPSEQVTKVSSGMLEAPKQPGEQVTRSSAKLQGERAPKSSKRMQRRT